MLMRDVDADVRCALMCVDGRIKMWMCVYGRAGLQELERLRLAEGPISNIQYPRSSVPESTRATSGSLEEVGRLMVDGGCTVLDGRQKDEDARSSRGRQLMQRRLGTSDLRKRGRTG